MGLLEIVEGMGSKNNIAPANGVPLRSSTILVDGGGGSIRVIMFSQ